MKKIILITGSNGMLAKKLGEQLEEGYTVRFLTRKVTRNNEYLWDLKKNYIDPKALKEVHTIIHLAGSSIAEKRWTKKRKDVILSSRVDSAHLILEELKRNNITIDSFISASAIGYYGATTADVIFDEESQKGNDFLSDVCSKWEDAAHAFESSSVAKRVAIVRIGIILAENDGALTKITQPIKYGIGSGLGTGKQYMPWIHIQDLCRLFIFVVNEEHISGTFNGVSPEHITNIGLTKKIGKVLNRPIIFPNIPKFIIQGLFGELGVILLEGSRVSSDKIVDAGFKFDYENLDDALNDIL
jgi:uncharacterized protein (TIGR01777 family)